MTQAAEQPPSPETLKRGYELPDVSNLGLVVFFIALALLIAVALAGIWGLTGYLIERLRDVDTVISIAPAQQRFPPPNLQPIERHNQLPYQDLADLRREKREIFQQLGWKVDEKTGVPAVPDDVINELAKERNGGGK